MSVTVSPRVGGAQRDCVHKLIIDELGKRHGRLLVVELVKKPTPSRAKTAWRCVCDCGKERVVLGAQLRQGAITSCGCTHFSHKRSYAVEYSTWNAMRFRCLNPNCKQYPNYGGRGIKVCDRWLKFENFFADMGERPGKGYSIDRIDPNGDYEPGNVQWADAKEQYRNRRVSLPRMTERMDRAIGLVLNSSIPSYSRAEVADLLRRLKRDLCGDMPGSA